MHAGLAWVFRLILKDVGIPDMVVVTEARGLRYVDASRLGDVDVLDFFAEGRHLVIDAVVATVYRNTGIQRVAYTTGYVKKHAKDRKLVANMTSTEPNCSNPW